MKKIITIITAIVLLILLSSSSFAVSKNKVVDDANLLSSSEVNSLEEYLNDISSELEFDVIIVTTNTLNCKSDMVYAEDFFIDNNCGYGSNQDGCILLIHMDDNRGFWIATHGSGINYINDNRIDSICDDIIDYLKNGQYYKAMKCFAVDVKNYVSNEDDEDFSLKIDSNGIAVGTNKINLSLSKFSIVVGAILGLIISLCIFFSKINELKTVYHKGSANDYLVHDSFVLEKRYDKLIGRYVTKTPINDNKNNSGSGSSTHTHSSGSSFGGGGRHF